MNLLPVPTQPIEREVIKVWIVGDAIELLLTVVGALVLLFVFASVPWAARLIAVAALFIIAIQLFAILSAPFRQARWRYELRERELEFESGLFVQSRVVVPLAAVQHVEVSEGPIERLCELVSLRVATAAGEHRVPGLRVETAEGIRRAIVLMVGIKDAPSVSPTVPATDSSAPESPTSSL